jgi:CRP-like cAMP-binding protein
MNGAELMQTLEDIQFVRDMPRQYLERIGGISRIVDSAAQAVIFREGDAADHIYLIASGAVSLEICAAGAGCRQILTLGAGELLGWSSLLGQSRFTARARTPHAARLVQISVPKLLQLCGSDPQFGYDLMRRTAIALAKRLSAARMQLVNVYGDTMPIIAEEDEASR